MKKAVLRDNMRKTKVGNSNHKNIQSQSPPHKKLMKKIEMTHKEPTNKYDFSLQENVFHQEPKEEVVDFRVEIERRFQKSVPNKTYVFPFKNLRNGNSKFDQDDSDESLNSSMDSLKFVTIYDLNSQNQKKHITKYHKTASYTNTVNPTTQHAYTQNFDSKDTSVNAGSKSLNKSKTNQNHYDDLSTKIVRTETYDDRPNLLDDEDAPIEVKIRDKNSQTYKNLIKLLDNQLNHKSPTPAAIPQKITQSSGTQSQNIQPLKPKNIINAKKESHHTSSHHNDVQNHSYNVYHRTRGDDAPKSNERMNHTEIRSSKYATAASSTNFKKTLSTDKVSTSKLDTNSTTISNLEKSIGNIGSQTTKGQEMKMTTIDLTKLTQESMKKIYSNNILKSSTPQHANLKSSHNFKENIFKTYTQENYPTKQSANNASSNGSTNKTPLTSLYQKAQNEVINHKNKAPSVKQSQTLIRKDQTSTAASMISTKREETPKDGNKKINFANFYGSPDQDKMSVLSVSQTNLSKKNSVKTMNNFVSPSKKQPSDKNIYMSYDLNNNSKVAKKPFFKLDLSKRSQGHRDALSSTRNRNTKYGEKGSEILNNDSLMRTSYDIQHYSSILNSSTQRNSNKKSMNFTPTNANMKNISFNSNSNKLSFVHKQL